LAAAIGPSLSGCGVENTPSTLRQVISILGMDETLSEDSRRELARFEVVYDEYVLPAAHGADNPSRQLAHFRDAFIRVRQDYVHDVADRVLVDAAILGVKESKAAPHSMEADALVEAALDNMLTSLDPHSSYLNARELNEMKVSNRGEFGGLGIEVTMQDGLVKVVAPIEDTPAYRAGLKAEDLITHIDGTPVKGMTLIEAVRLMRGKPNTTILLTISRADTAPFDVSIKRDIIKVQSVRWHLEKNVGYVRVVNFTERVGPGIVTAMYDINEKLGPNLAGIVLDLRNNPGGLLHQSLLLADAFIEQGTIVSVRGRRDESERVFTAEEGDTANGRPIVVLINRGSASASEIVAGALQEQGRAIIMGQRSFGKGSVQTITPLPKEGALRLTTQLYYLPTGRAIQARGIDPDIEIIPLKTEEQQAKTDEAPSEEEKRSRESDLPGAISPIGKDGDGLDHTSLSENKCQPAGDKEDRTLGCALALIRAGSAAKFLASLGLNQTM